MTIIPESPKSAKRSRNLAIPSSPSKHNGTKHTKNQSIQRRHASLPSSTVEYLKAWMMSPEHIAHPYPTEAEKAQIMVETGIELKQLTNWFVNNRKRYWKPRVEAKMKEHEAHGQVVVIPPAASKVTNKPPSSSSSSKKKVVEDPAGSSSISIKPKLSCPQNEKLDDAKEGKDTVVLSSTPSDYMKTHHNVVSETSCCASSIGSDTSVSLSDEMSFSDDDYDDDENFMHMDDDDKDEDDDENEAIRSKQQQDQELITKRPNILLAIPVRNPLDCDVALEPLRSITSRTTIEKEELFSLAQINPYF